MKKYVVYQAIVGDYDRILQPTIVDDRFDYILFSDTFDIPFVGVWQVRELPFSEGNNKQKCGFAKCHIEELLPEYEASLWIDGNIQITSQYVYDRFVELMSLGIEWASIKHPSQHCTYDEICAIVKLRWVADYEVADWYKKLREECFPENWGLFETNVLFRRHDARVYKASSLWWQTLLLNIRRDQFSVMYALWRDRLKVDYYLIGGECPRIGSKHFAYHEHNPHKRVRKLGFHEMMRYRIIRTKYTDNIRKGYKEMFDWVSRFRYPKAALFLWEIIFVARYAPKIIRVSLKHRLKWKSSRR